ncbi:MAG TPA: hypothetical protein VNJ08_10225 [Bacteriovoracaceae bacterium]|nr:hypothetical protein [Bacteriovoracaceae bacterium]
MQFQAVLISIADPACNHAFAPQIPWNDKAYWDVGYSVVADRYETGCKISAMAGNTGSTAPAGGFGSDGNVYYTTLTSAAADRGNGIIHGRCFVKAAGSWGSYVEGTATVAQHSSMTTNEPGYPPIAISQGHASNSCQQRSVAGVGNLRLWRRHELVAARAWKGIHNNPSTFQTALYTSGDDHPTNGSCNTKFADGVPQTSPQVSTVNMFMRMVTGSWATRNCVSRYELHDQIGNFDEWTSDQLFNCHILGGCTFGASSLDTGNVHLEDFSFDNVNGPQWGSGYAYGTYAYNYPTYGIFRGGTTMIPMLGLFAKTTNTLLGSMPVTATHITQEQDVAGFFNSVLGATDGSGYVAGRFGMGMFPIDEYAYVYDVGAPAAIYGFYQPFGYRCVGEIPN